MTLAGKQFGRLGLVGSKKGNSAQVQQFFNRLVTQPSVLQQAAYRTLIDGGVLDGWWSKLDFLHLLEAPDSATAGVNLISGKFYLAKVGAPNFQTDFTGYRGTGSGNDYLDPQYLLSSLPAGSLYTQNSATNGVLISAGPASGADSGGAIGGPNAYYAEIYPHYVDNHFYWAGNGAAEQSGAPGASTGVFAWTRSAANTNISYRNGVQDTAAVDASSALPAQNITIMQASGNAAHTNLKLGAAFSGGALTATDHANISTRLLAYQTAVSGMTGSADLITVGPTASTIISDGAFNATPGVAKLQNGNLFCVWSAASDNSVTDGVWKHKTSTDNGVTWSAATTLYTPPAGFSAVDVEIVVLTGGAIIVSGSIQKNADHTQDVVRVFIGAADASSFSGPITAATAVFPNGTYLGGKIKELTGGTLALPVYGVVPGDLSNYSSGLTFSTDGGNSWGNAVVTARGGASNSYSESDGAQLASGRIPLIVRQDAPVAGYARVYTDDATGASGWTSPAPITTGATISSAGRPAIVQSAASRFFMWGRFGAFNASRWAWSLDAGVTWTPFTPFGTLTSEYFYASTVLVSAHVIGSVLATSPSGTPNVANIVYQDFAQ